jgi:hypothetical protein
VHVDVRERAAQWVDWSTPGRRAQYGNLRGPWRRVCRRPGSHARRGCEREGRRVTREGDVPEEVELTVEASALMPVVPLVVGPEVEPIEEPSDELEDEEEDEGES